MDLNFSIDWLVAVLFVYRKRVEWMLDQQKSVVRSESRCQKVTLFTSAIGGKNEAFCERINSFSLLRGDYPALSQSNRIK